MQIATTGFDVEAVRVMLEQALAAPVTPQDVYDLTRRGYPLEKAQIRRGFYRKATTLAVVREALSKRLLAQLGRVSPRFPGTAHDITCRTCKGHAVSYDGRWLCENGHGGNTNE